MLVIPVALPSGRAMFFNRPTATGSATLMKTIGMVCVRCNTARATGWELAAMTSGPRPTNSSAYLRNKISVVGGIAKVEPHIATLNPAQFREPLQQGALQALNK